MIFRKWAQSNTARLQLFGWQNIPIQYQHKHYLKHAHTRSCTHSHAKLIHTYTHTFTLTYNHIYTLKLTHARIHNSHLHTYTLWGVLKQKWLIGTYITWESSLDDSKETAPLDTAEKWHIWTPSRYDSMHKTYASTNQIICQHREKSWNPTASLGTTGNCYCWQKTFDFLWVYSPTMLQG